jgi:hypothetical protein
VRCEPANDMQLLLAIQRFRSHEFEAAKVVKYVASQTISETMFVNSQENQTIEIKSKKDFPFA